MKRIYLCGIVITALILLMVILSIPYVDKIDQVDVSCLEEYPSLHNSYRKLCNDHSLYEIVTEDTIHIVTVKNIWGSWQRYILACFAADIPTIPRAGTCRMTAFMHVLSVWEDENIFTKMCPLKLTLNVGMTPGENTFVYERVKIVPGEDMTIFDGLVVPKPGLNCDNTPSVFVYYHTATASSADDVQRDQLVEVSFVWKYFLELCGKQILFHEHSLQQNYTVNA